ncbi:E3 ubiquitin-protein ligase znrf2 isoform X1 [Clupea harengus]|uniref:RING-type E3 ubiquitin transferase n=1 Tax=Clupea harengus TaxID=7950 RepID=A0A6P8G7P4_CLUHA|nr:E3 ubiquitin-protein ligase znrf2 isoform X1 [Clupea harengus]
MGAKQSSPAANGRMRAYSGSDLPSSTSTSNGNSRTAAMGMRYAYGGTAHGASGATAASSHHIGSRTRSVGGSGGGSGTRPQSGINIPSSRAYSSHESGSSTPEESGGDSDRSGAVHGGPRLLIGSLPAHLSPHLFGGFKCPVCSKFVSSDEMDLHLVMCLTKPRVTYNGKDVCFRLWLCDLSFFLTLFHYASHTHQCYQANFKMLGCSWGCAVHQALCWFVTAVFYSIP